VYIIQHTFRSDNKTINAHKLHNAYKKDESLQVHSNTFFIYFALADFHLHTDQLK